VCSVRGLARIVSCLVCTVSYLARATFERAQGWPDAFDAGRGFTCGAGHWRCWPMWRAIGAVCCCAAV